MDNVKTSFYRMELKEDKTILDVGERAAKVLSLEADY